MASVGANKSAVLTAVTAASKLIGVELPDFIRESFDPPKDPPPAPMEKPAPKERPKKKKAKKPKNPFLDVEAAEASDDSDEYAGDPNDSASAFNKETGEWEPRKKRRTEKKKKKKHHRHRHRHSDEEEEDEEEEEEDSDDSTREMIDDRPLDELIPDDEFDSEGASKKKKKQLKRLKKRTIVSSSEEEEVEAKKPEEQPKAHKQTAAQIVRKNLGPLFELLDADGNEERLDKIVSCASKQVPTPSPPPPPPPPPPAPICIEVEFSYFRDAVLWDTVTKAWIDYYEGGVKAKFDHYVKGKGKGVLDVSVALGKARTKDAETRDLNAILAAVGDGKSGGAETVAQQLVRLAGTATSLSFEIAQDDAPQNCWVVSAHPGYMMKPSKVVVARTVRQADGKKHEAVCAVCDEVALIMYHAFALVSLDAWIRTSSVVCEWCNNHREVVAKETMTLEELRNDLKELTLNLWNEWDQLRREFCTAVF